MQLIYGKEDSVPLYWDSIDNKMEISTDLKQAIVDEFKESCRLCFGNVQIFCLTINTNISKSVFSSDVVEIQLDMQPMLKNASWKPCNPLVLHGWTDREY